MMSKISIIIPCYNVQNYIAQCLDSVIHQTYKNLEIICINDGSLDNTLEILDRYAKDDTRIKLYNQSNKGLSQSRTKGIEYATGEYILFVDSDDWLEVTCLETILEKQDNYDIICFSYFRNFKNVSLSRKFNLEGQFSAADLQRRIIGPLGNELAHIENLDALATVWGKLYKSDKLKGLSFPEVKTIGTWEDGLFNLYVLEKCNNVLIIDQPLYHYRKDNLQSFTSKSKDNLYLKWKHKFELIRLLIEFKDQSYNNALQNRIAISILGLSLTETGSQRNALAKIKNLKSVLEEPVYSSALKNFRLNSLPMQWKIFYSLAKSKSAVGIYILASMIQLIQKLKNL